MRRTLSAYAPEGIPVKNDEESNRPAGAPLPAREGNPGMPAEDGKELLQWYQTEYVIDEDGKWRYRDRVVLGEEELPPPPAGRARLWLALAASVLALAVIVAAWLWQRQAADADPQAQTSEKDLGLIDAQLRELLPPRQIGEDPAQRRLSAELAGKAKFLLTHGSDEQNALAKIVLKNDEGADFLINAAKQEPAAQVFRLLTLQGHNWYNAGEFDRAVKFYEQALMLQPENVEALRNAAIAHSQAKQGDGVAHWRRTVELLRQAVDQATDGSAEWCELQNNLGLAWMDSVEGDRGSNLQRAVAAFRTAQGRLSCDGEQALWAKLQNNLGTAWLKMQGGDPASNLRNAIAAFQQALEVYTRKEQPLEWAVAKGNLGEAWTAMAALPGSDSGASLAQAVAAFRSALDALDREEYPLEWAKAQSNLGQALDLLPAGNPDENRRQAIAAFQAAEKIYSRALQPMDWASTRFRQAVALKHLADAAAKGCDHLWQSMAYLKAVAGVWTPEAFPDSNQNQLAPLTQAVREAWRARDCGADKTLDGIPAAK